MAQAAVTISRKKSDKKPIDEHTEHRLRILKTKPRDILQIALTGFVAGILIWLTQMAISTWVIDPLFCRTPDMYSVCQNATQESYIAALVIVGALSISILSIIKVYRPMLVVLAALASLWAISPWLGMHTWWAAALWCGGLVAVSYALYGLVARIRSFGLALLVCVVLVVIFQFVMSML